MNLIVRRICRKIKADFFDRIYLILQHGGQYLQIQGGRMKELSVKNIYIYHNHLRRVK